MATAAELRACLGGEGQRRAANAGRYQVNGKEPAGHYETHSEKRLCRQLRFADFGAGLG
jgi:hypothetical protein